MINPQFIATMTAAEAREAYEAAERRAAALEQIRRIFPAVGSAHDRRIAAELRLRAELEQMHDGPYAPPTLEQIEAAADDALYDKLRGV